MILNDLEIKTLRKGMKVTATKAGIPPKTGASLAIRPGATKPTKLRAEVLSVVVDREADNWTVTLRLDRRPIEQAPRLLHQRSQYGYTSLPHLAMSAEPEVIDTTNLAVHWSGDAAVRHASAADRRERIQQLQRNARAA